MVAFHWTALPKKLLKIGWPLMFFLLLAGATAAFYIMKLRTRPKGLKNGEPQGAAVATVNSLPPDISLHKKKQINICHIQATIFGSLTCHQMHFLTNSTWNNHKKLKGLNYVLQTLNAFRIEMGAGRLWKKLWNEDLTTKDFMEETWIS